MTGGAREAFDAFVVFVSAAVPDGEVAAGDPQGATGGSVRMRPVSLDRVNRSRRKGPVLDLSLTVEVTCTGPSALDHLEDLLVAVELSDAYALLPGTAEAATLPMPGTLRARVAVPVAVDLPIPPGPPVTAITVQWGDDVTVDPQDDPIVLRCATPRDPQREEEP